MSENVENKSRDRIMMILLVFFFLAIGYLHTLLPAFSPKSETSASEILKGQIITILGFGLGLVQLMLSVEMVLADWKHGFLLSVGLNSFNIISVILAFFVRNEVIAIPGVAISIISITISIIIYRQHRKIAVDMEKLKNLSYFDSITGLPNRNYMIDEIDKLIISRIPEFSIAVFDVDNFRMINDTLGHNVGDIYISELSHILKKFIQKPNLLGKIGADEFVVVFPESLKDEEIESKVSEISNLISKPFTYKNQTIKLTASVGIVRYPKDSESTKSLLQQLDMAIFRAKSHGKDCVVFFDETMQQNLERRLSVEQRLSNAIQRKELYIEYQPQFALPNKELRGFEVLVRWHSPILGQVAPLDFIPLAEENGMIIEVGSWIFREACTQYMRLYSESEDKPMLSVNVSVIQMRDLDFLNIVKKILEETKMDTSHLEFEITESVFIKTPDIAKQIIFELKNMGIKIALDDFGTGYSSLSYLRNLPFDVVKIDKSFIDTIGTTEKNIVKSIIEMAHQLDLKVISEGIENQVQLDYLIENNCDFVQGHFLGKPLLATGL